MKHKHPAATVDLLARPDTSHWLRNALLAALDRDPVDAARDSEILSIALRLRADVALTEAKAELDALEKSGISITAISAPRA